MAAQQTERGDLADAPCARRALAERGVAEGYHRIQPAQARHECRRRARMETVRVPYDDLCGGPFETQADVVGLLLRDPGARRPQVLDLRLETPLGLGRDLLERGSRTRRHDRGDQTLDERGGGDPHPSRRLGIDELESHLRRQDGAAQVEQHQHPVGGVRGRDRLRDRGRVRTERRLVQPCGDLDRRSGFRGHHLLRQTDRRDRERSAVRDDGDADHGRQARVLAAASTSSVTLVAPGSWTPALRSPRYEALPLRATSGVVPSRPTAHAAAAASSAACVP